MRVARRSARRCGRRRISMKNKPSHSRGAAAVVSTPSVLAAVTPIWRESRSQRVAPRRDRRRPTAVERRSVDRRHCVSYRRSLRHKHLKRHMARRCSETICTAGPRCKDPLLKNKGYCGLELIRHQEFDPKSSRRKEKRNQSFPID